MAVIIMMMLGARVMRVVLVGFVRMSVVMPVLWFLGPLVPAGAPIERFLLDGVARSLLFRYGNSSYFSAAYLVRLIVLLRMATRCS